MNEKAQSKIKTKTPDSLALLHEGREERDAQLILAVRGEKFFRDIAAEKGLSWDALTDEEKNL